MYGSHSNKPAARANLLNMIIFLSSFLLVTAATDTSSVSSESAITLDGKSTLFGICNFGLGRREKFEKAVKSSFPKSAKNTSVSIVKVTYSSACRNTVRRSLTDEESQEINSKNVPSTHVAYTVTNDDNINLNINQVEIEVTESINNRFKKIVTASMTTIALDPTLLSIQSDQDNLEAKLDTFEANVSAKFESIEATLLTVQSNQEELMSMMKSLITTVKNDSEAIIGSISSIETAIEDVDTDVAAVRTDTKTIIRSVSNVANDIADVDIDVADVKNDTEAIIEEISSVDNEIANEDTDIAAVKNDTEAIIDSVTSVKSDIGDVDADVTAVKTDTGAIIDSVSDVETDIADLDTDVAAVKNDTEAIIDSVSDVETDIADLDTDVAAVKTDTGAIIDSVSDVETDIADLDTDVTAVKNDTGAIIDSVSDVETDIADLDTDVADIKNDTVATTDNLQVFRDESAEIHESLIESVQSLTDQLIHSDSPSSIPSISNSPSLSPSAISSTAPSISNSPSLSLSPSISMVPSVSSAPTVTPPLRFSIYGEFACGSYLSKVQCVGNNQYGAIGLDPYVLFGIPRSSTSVPNTLSFSSSATPKKVVTGFYHTCVLLRDGTAFCLGRNSNGQLGDGTITDSFTPVQMKKDGIALTNIADIAAGNDHTCVILNVSEELYCFGLDSDGQLGFSGEQNVKMMALSQPATCIVSTSDETQVRCKGDDNFNNKVYSMENKKVVKLTAGYGFFCALLEDSTAKCFGYNYAYQLGNGSTTSSFDNAVDVLLEANTPLSGITDINGGADSTCVIANGSPMCFGDNGDYQLGIANGGTNVLYPTELTVGLPTGKEIVSVHPGESTGHAVFSDNSVYAWGRNSQGTLGDGSTITQVNLIGYQVGQNAVLMNFDDFN